MKKKIITPEEFRDDLLKENERLILENYELKNQITRLETVIDFLRESGKKLIVELDSLKKENK